MASETKKRHLWYTSTMDAAKRVLQVLGLVVAWAWTVIAGGGGLGLLIEQGPWPPTNGWFALFSGISACPATAWLFRKLWRVELSGRVRLAAAVLFVLAGRAALVIEHRGTFLPTLR